MTAIRLSFTRCGKAVSERFTAICQPSLSASGPDRETMAAKKYSQKGLTPVFNQLDATTSQQNFLKSQGSLL